MLELTFKGLVSLEPARKWAFYLVLCFSFMSSASFKFHVLSMASFCFCSMKDSWCKISANLIFYIICLAITSKYVSFIILVWNKTLENKSLTKTIEYKTNEQNTKYSY